MLTLISIKQINFRRGSPSQSVQQSSDQQLSKAQVKSMQKSLLVHLSRALKNSVPVIHWIDSFYNINRGMDKSETQEELRQAEADLRRLRKEKQLPPLMQLKLAYLEALLLDSSSKHDIGERLQAEQREAIEDLPNQTRKRLFIDTVKCLSGRQVITYCRNERVYLRREAKLFSWEKCYLNCSSNLLTIFPKKESKTTLFRFQLQKVCISKNYKKYKNKYVIAIDFQGSKYVIGFDEEITCKRVHGVVRELIDQNREWQTTLYDNNQFIEEREAQRLALPAHRVRQIIYEEEFQHLNSLQQKVKEFDVYKDTDFQLHKNIAQGRVLTTKKGLIKTQVILKGIEAFLAASNYVKMSSWNKAIQICDIVGRPRTNCLIANIKTKKYSMMSYPRGAALGISFFKICDCQKQVKQNKYCLLIQSLPGHQNLGGVTVMDFRQIVQFIPSLQDPNIILLNSVTKADFKGFCSESDNLAMALHITEQIEQYCQYVQSTKVQKDKILVYFESVACPCGFVNDNDDVSLPTERQELNSQLRGSLNGLALVPQLRQKEITAAMQDTCRSLINEQMIEIMRSRSFEKYYLKHRFSQKDESIEVTKGEVRNFLNEGSRWRLQKQELIFMDAQVLSAQKDILKMVLKQISSCIMQGKSVMNMSLPVQIFDKRSLLDAIPDSYGFLPAYAPRIVAAQDPVEQMKLVAAVFIFTQATDPNIEKPFNPILGETYQGRLGDFQVYIQQISHHPPISAVLIKNQDMEMSGNVEIVIGMGLNCVHSHVTDWLRAKVYSTGTEYMIKIGGIQLGGLVYGSRSYKMVNIGCIFQKKNSLYCEFSVGRDKKRVYESKPKPKSSDLTGGIFKVNQQFCEHILSCKKPTAFEGIKPEHIVQTCCLITGKWYGDLYYNGVCYKSYRDGPFPMRGERMKYVLPSDSIWRLDVIYRIWKDFQRSNREKEKLENSQRNDRKLRENFKKHK